MAEFKARIGYGQVEPNHLSAKRTGQIYAQLPAGADLGDVIENGQFVKYDYANKECNLSGKGEWMLVYNEIKLYDERHQMYKDYAMKKSDFMDGVMVPRVFKTNIGDIYTTNMLDDSITTIEEGDLLTVGEDGILTEATGSETEMVFEVAQVYTMADCENSGVKIVRIK